MKDIVIRQNESNSVEWPVNLSLLSVYWTIFILELASAGKGLRVFIAEHLEKSGFEMTFVKEKSPK